MTAEQRRYWCPSCEAWIDAADTAPVNVGRGLTVRYHLTAAHPPARHYVTARPLPEGP